MNTKLTLPDSEPRPNLPRTKRVWIQLGEMFGKAFFRENGDNPPPLWQQAVDRLTDPQIRNGLVNMGNMGLSFPPNLSQFVAACKRVEETNSAPYWKALPPPEYDRAAEEEKAWQHMEKLTGRKLR